MIPDIDQLPNEKWKPMFGFEGFYLISSYGRVWSLPHGKAKKSGRLLKLQLSNAGYVRVYLMASGIKYYELVSRLVLKTFVGPEQPRSRIRSSSA